MFFRVINIETLENSYEIMFDCTGSKSGFENSVKLANRILHVKSTCGAEAFHCKQWTAFVVEEFSIFSWKSKDVSSNPFQFKFSPSGPSLVENSKVKHRKYNILVSEKVIENSSLSFSKFKDFSKEYNVNYFIKNGFDALHYCNSIIDPISNWNSPFCRFDLTLISSLSEIDQFVRPMEGKLQSPLLSRSLFVVLPNDEDKQNCLLEQKIIRQNLAVRSSRCGRLDIALSLLSENQSLCECLEKFMISKKFSLTELPNAISAAQDKNCIKVVLVNDLNDAQ